ncbi:MAG: hypothetical protein LBJ64_05840 [Deltaproteobacteria bacterium]|jgi:hypothetical protein|nr:hypothetical protein [Deltaproteobacteria bacterium]
MSIKRANLRYLASTEHVYKNPLESYLYLEELGADLPLTVIPGVEWISRENVEIIFLFDGEASLCSALRTLKPFSHSVWSAAKLAEDLGAVLSVPHPFTPGVTGAANCLGLDAFERLLDMVDYVEIHNGLAKQFKEFLFYDRFGSLFPRHSLKVSQTDQLPSVYRRSDIGWAIGSDAHFPGEIYFAGHHEAMTGSDWFGALKKRLHFQKVDLTLQKPELCRWRRSLASLRTVMNEALIKKKIRLFGFKEV